MTIGKMIKQRRVELGLTMEQVAKAIGVGKGTIAKWENGQIANMRRDKISLLSSVLMISPMSFISCDESILFNAEPLKPKSKDISLSSHEQSLIQAYRSHPEMQSAVDKLLGIEDDIEKEKTGTA